ncbi:MAG: hypothetical protein LH467_02930 [Gemmatimonadaceae bacterium]|nr:hypothetical protein [Gemmatimonadaceae bacterium]
MSGFPILIEGAGVRALVVGGGAVAVRKATALLDAGAHVRVVAPAIAQPLHDRVSGGRLELMTRTYATSDIADAQLVVVATDDRAVNAAAALDARTAGRLVNVADAPGEGSFSTMATHRLGALIVGVSAGGVPSAAARIRDAIAMRFDARYASALSDLSALRRRLLDDGKGESWRRRADLLIDERFCDAVESGELAARVSAWR